MSNLTSNFSSFLSEIRLTDNQRRMAGEGHKTLRERLMCYEDLNDFVITTFLQGSYKRATAVRPFEGEKSDVDIVVVTNLDRTRFSRPADVINMFLPFVKKYYAGKYDNTQSRSIGIELSDIKMDLVITSAPSETGKQLVSSNFIESNDSVGESDTSEFTNYLQNNATWKNEPLWIPDRDANQWQQTHPLAQIAWTIDKNRTTNGHFVNVVKALKWWQRTTDEMPKYPKSYPFEHIIGEACPDGIDSVASGIVLTLENIMNLYGVYAELKTCPAIRDRGVDQNVLKSISGNDFYLFYMKAKEAASLARQAYNSKDDKESMAYWTKLFGVKFQQTLLSKAATELLESIVKSGNVQKPSTIGIRSIPVHKPWCD